MSLALQAPDYEARASSSNPVAPTIFRVVTLCARKRQIVSGAFIYQDLLVMRILRTRVSLRHRMTVCDWF